MVGTGLQGTVLGARASMEGFATLAIGIIMSGYYVGYLIGSTRAPHLLARVGHIRVFAALSSLAAAAMLAHSLWVHPLPWVAFRLITGLCLAGLFVVAESWLSGQAEPATRGRLLALYMVVVLGGLLAGQLLLSWTGAAGSAGIVAAALLVSLAVVPVALTRQSGPPLAPVTRVTVRQLVEVAPLAVMGVMLSGAASGVIYGLAAVYASAAGLPAGQIALFAGAAVAGAMLSQLPLGRLSDRLDRRLVIAGMASAATLAAALGGLAPTDSLIGPAVAFAAVGALSLPLYAIFVAHLGDNLASAEITAAGSRLVLVQGAGASVGPLVGAGAMAVVGPEGFFWFLAAAHVPIAVFALWRVVGRPAATTEQRVEYLPLTSGSTSVVLAMADGEPPGVAPPFLGELTVEGGTLHYRTRGEGPTVLLVHGAGESALTWVATARQLSAAGVRTVSVDLPGHGLSTVPPVLDLGVVATMLADLLDHLDAAPAVVVARGAGNGLAIELAGRHPDHVDAVIAVDPAWGLGPRHNPDRLAGHAGVVGDAAARRMRGVPTTKGATALRRAVLEAGLDRWLPTIVAPVVVVASDAEPARGWAGDQRLIAGVGEASRVVVPGSRGRLVADDPSLIEVLVAVVGERLADERVEPQVDGSAPG